MAWLRPLFGRWHGPVFGIYGGDDYGDCVIRPYVDEDGDVIVRQGPLLKSRAFIEESLIATCSRSAERWG